MSALASTDTSQTAAQQAQALLAVTWTDFAGTPWLPGEPQTVLDAFAQYLGTQWQTAYQEAADDTLQPGDTSPYDMATTMQLDTEARQAAAARLDEYQQRLKAFLATNPDEDSLVTWLAHRAMADAGIWARGDALEMRRRAVGDVLQRNPRQGRYQILPETAAEPRCRDVAGVIYPSAAAAQAALGAVWHRGCVHYVDPVV